MILVYHLSGADTGFPEGGGGEAPPLGHCPRDVIRPPKNCETPPLLDIHKHHPPLDIVRVTSSALPKIEKHTHSWTFTSTPPWTLWRHPHSKGGGGWSVPVTHTLHRFSVSGQVQGGGGWSPLPPPPWIRHWSMMIWNKIIKKQL